MHTVCSLSINFWSGDYDLRTLDFLFNVKRSRYRRRWFDLDGFPGENVKQITDPFLLVVDDHDEFISVEQSAEIFRMISNAEFATIPGADHLGVNACNEPYASVVTDFIERHL